MADEREKRIETLEREFDRLNAELQLIDAGDPADQWAEEVRVMRDAGLRRERS
jgi:hypothetical protein